MAPSKDRAGTVGYRCVVDAQLSTEYQQSALTYGVGCSVVLNKYGPSNSVLSPAFLPHTGCRRADSGFFHFQASAATSPKIRRSCSTLTSPGNGRVSSPVPQTAE